MDIGIVGNGVVGSAFGKACAARGQTVKYYDAVPERRTHDLYEVAESDLVFVCLPTPAMTHGACDVYALNTFFNMCMVDPKLWHRNWVIRSTVPVGFTERVRTQYKIPNVCHFPEFLTARVAESEAVYPRCNLIGVSSELYQSSLFTYLLRLLVEIYPGVPRELMTSDETELVKLTTNAFFGVKLSFFNELFAFCRAKKIDYRMVIRGVMADGRVSPHHTNVPGPDGGLGFGGACLPKDLASLAYQLALNGITPHTMNGAQETNKAVRV